MAQSGGPGPSGSGGNGGTIKQVSFFIPNESAPPGGVVQMKFMVTEPTPISTGRPVGYFDPATFDGFLGFQLFNSAADVNGVALIEGNRVQIQYISSSGLQGTDYPVMTMALHVRQDAVPGTRSLFSLDPSSTWTLGDLGVTTLKPVPPAIITVGGSVSITNVVPGGGILPAGAVVSIRGLGFQPKTQVQLNAIKSSSIQLISPNEIQFTLAQTTNMTGQKIQVVNPDGSQDTYFSYLRGIPFRQSNQPLLAHAEPIFSAMTYSMAAFNAVAPASALQFTGVAMQNPSPSTAIVSVSLYSAAGTLMGTSVIAIPSGYRLMNEISELTQGAAPVPGSYLVVSASQPIQVFGFTGDIAAGTVVPFAAAVTKP
jgi:hypothetical protein